MLGLLILQQLLESPFAEFFGYEGRLESLNSFCKTLAEVLLFLSILVALLLGLGTMGYPDYVKHNNGMILLGHKTPVVPSFAVFAKDGNSMMYPRRADGSGFPAFPVPFVKRVAPALRAGYGGIGLPLKQVDTSVDSQSTQLPALRNEA